MERGHPLAGMFQPLPAVDVERAIERARERYSALTPADFRRMRREDRWERLSARVRRVLGL